MNAWRATVLLIGLVLLCMRPAAAVPGPTLLVRDAADRAVGSAVVYLRGANPVRTAAPLAAVIDQRDKVFVPTVTVIEVGAEVRFPNSDAVSHHVYSFAQPNAFELPLYKGGQRPVVRFDHAGVVTLGCNIHDAMIGWIVVVDSPYFGNTDEQGRITFQDMPAGSYEAFVWSQQLDPGRPLGAGKVIVDGSSAVQRLAVGQRQRRRPPEGVLAGGDY